MPVPVEENLVKKEEESLESKVEANSERAQMEVKTVVKTEEVN